ncbi:uncharacterized protein LOC111715153 isoform X2 [Eurytemora carolleeae]|uniref:uncharacterized protein LOC111715153 isoform X2 n=1 Tax=Eurytemora carolleeae TaxID=1294199 RepID=UPI000C75AA7E|nr:uncharacterized protein LOC111715153 isoform X2 [Eurytemora carolleeae]|eukprot:XP_023346200.1 uncharacterized protein LOC111715153 isoform X2 [Eurytemora affinis]
MFAAISLLAITFAVVSAAGSADQCCLQRRVNSVDERGGVYSLDVNLTLIADISSSPVCSTNCIYTKVGKSGQIFCFGHGSLTSECSITPAGPKRPDFTTIMIGGSVGMQK